MKKLFFLLFCLLTLQSQAEIRAILVEPNGSTYRLTIYGRIPGGTAEKIDIKDVAEISKLTGIEGQSEFDLKGVKPIRYWIWFCDGDLTHDTFDPITQEVTGTVVDKVSGTLSYIDFHSVVSEEFVQKKIDPIIQGSKTAIEELKTLVETKPVDDGK